MQYFLKDWNSLWCIEYHTAYLFLKYHVCHMQALKKREYVTH